MRVPCGRHERHLDPGGAQGGRGLFGTTTGGQGAHVQATLAVTSGETLVVSGRRAQQSRDFPSTGAGGFNGGGAGGIAFHHVGRWRRRLGRP